MPAKKLVKRTSKNSTNSRTKPTSVSVSTAADATAQHGYQECGFDHWSAVILERSKSIAESMSNADGAHSILARVATGRHRYSKPSDVYLHAIPEAYRQQHNCRTCKDFLDAYADVVVCRPDGSITPLLFSALDWHEVPAFYQAAHMALANRLSHLLVTAEPLEPFYADSTSLGTARNVDKYGVKWTHFSAVVAKKFTVQYKKPSLLSDAETLSSAVKDYAKSGAVAWIHDRSTTLGLLPAQQHMIDVFSRLCKEYTSDHTIAHWQAMILCAAANHPDVAHIRGSVLGAAMDRVKLGQSTELITSFVQSVNSPLKHMRPTTVTEGNIKRADKLIEELELESAFKRRIATVEELKKEGRLLWYPSDEKETKATKKPTGFASEAIGLTASSRAGSYSACEDGGSMTWAYFVARVMPRAKTIHAILRLSAYYGGITTAVDKTAKPLFYWDTEEQRNPYAWFVTNPASSPESAGVRSTCRVTGICSIPCVWTKGNQQHDGALLLLDGAKPPVTTSLAIFPACLRPELREIRSSVERISAGGRLQRKPGAAAYGLWLSPSGSLIIVQMTVEFAGGLRQTITIDRWM